MYTGANPAASSSTLRSRNGTSRTLSSRRTISRLGLARPVSTKHRCRAEISASVATASWLKCRAFRQYWSRDPTDDGTGRVSDMNGVSTCARATSMTSRASAGPQSLPWIAPEVRLEQKISRMLRKPRRSSGDSDIAAARLGIMPIPFLSPCRDAFEPSGAESIVWTWQSDMLTSCARTASSPLLRSIGRQTVPFNSLGGKREEPERAPANAPGYMCSVIAGASDGLSWWRAWDGRRTFQIVSTTETQQPELNDANPSNVADSMVHTFAKNSNRGHAPLDLLRENHEVGGHAVVVNAEPGAGAAEPDEHLVGDENDAMPGAVGAAGPRTGRA